MIGRTIGQYHIQEQLGKGGMGIVYKAHDERLDRTVALKFLPPHLSADENSKQRFKQEARAASALDHNNICTIHDIGEADDGQLFIVMTFYDGETLKYKLESGKLGPQEAIRMAHQISLGLARAHEAGIVHRDVKPANVMVTSRGEVKILDFGVAKLSQSSELTKTGSTIGTAAYMSPEQARGESVDLRADIWSVGILLYEMLTGVRPFEGGYEAAMIYAIVNQDPAPLAEHAPDCPHGLQDIVSKCLSKKQEERYLTSGELAAALEPFLSASGTMSSARVVVPIAVPQPASIFKISAAFALASIVVLAVLYAGMIGFGLPDWVFPTGIVLMLLGIPSLFFAAHNERKLAESKDSSRGASPFTIKRAVWGGVLSMSALVVFSALFMAMRAMGIGPAATLQSSGLLDENAKLIVAEFENRTNDPTLSESVSELLRIDLSQSAAIVVMDGSSIVSVLSRMNREQDAKIDLNTAMEIAAREGAEAVVAGEISQLGSGYVLAARLLAAHDGSELLALRETAADDGAIIPAMDRLSADLREQIGESIKTIRSNDDLDRVTTSSLDALRLYSQGVAATDLGDYRRSIELLTQAIERDSTFAMAYRKLAVVYNNSVASPELGIEAASNAYRLRDRLPPRERGLATAYYYAEVDRDRDQRVAAYERIIDQFPDETAALNNVAIDYMMSGDYEKAELHARRALAVGNKDVYFNKLVNALSAQKRWDELDEVFTEYAAVHRDHPNYIFDLFSTEIARGRFDGADSLIRSANFSPDPAWEWWDTETRIHYRALLGQISGMKRETEEAIALGLERNVLSSALVDYIGEATVVYDALGDREQALARIDEGLQKIPLESLHPLARPYSRLVILYARLGQTDEAERLMGEYDAVVPEGIRKGDLQRHRAKGELLVAEGRIKEGLEAIRLVHSVDMCKNCHLYREGQLLEQLDSLDAAVAAYTEFSEITNPIGISVRAADMAPAYFRLGELHSRLGNLDAAVDAYSRFVDIWKNADSQLQPQVAYARDRIGRLLDQSTRESQ